MIDNTEDASLNCGTSLSGETYIDLLTRCILAFCEQSPETSLNRMLEILGTELQCRRIALYELKPACEYFFLSYSYGDAFEKKLTNYINKNFLPVKSDLWKNFIAKREAVVLNNDETLKTIFQEQLPSIQKSGIHSIILLPLYSNSNFLGFLCITSVSSELPPFLSLSVNLLSQLIASTMKKQNLIERLNFLSFHDNLTKSLNRNALKRDLMLFEKMQPRGVVYADLCGLKKLNDSKGHKYGDQLLLNAYDCLCRVYDSQTVYRVGGDEFIILCGGGTQTQFDKKLKKLQSALQKDQHQLLLAVGSCWDETGHTAPNQMIDTAEINMYRNKKNIYCNLEIFLQNDARTPQPIETKRSPFSHYIRNYYFDPEILINSISDQENSYYLFVGDMKENIFYISDHMKDDFLFESNIVPDLIHKWGALIIDQDRTGYYDDINAILVQKKKRHNLCYQVRNAKGELIWVRCQGIIQWENKKPLLFAGIITNLQEEHTIDPITGLWGATELIKQLKILAKTGGSIIGVKLNDFSAINDSYGRTEGDRMLRNITQIFQVKLGAFFYFYRIDTTKFVVVSRNAEPMSFSQISEKIKNIVSTIYSERHLFIQHPCSVSFLEIPKNYAVDKEIILMLSNFICQANDQKVESCAALSEGICSEKQKKSQMIIRLNKSVADGFSDFYLDIQPITNKALNPIVAGEVLLRWKHDDEIIPPRKFIPILEKHRLIQPVGNWVFEEAVKYSKQIAKIDPNFRIFINISYLQVADPTFFDFIMATIQKYEVSPDSFVLELTETFMHNLRDVLFDFITRVQKEGFLFAIDDFGSNFSSLNFLFECPSDIIKIDRVLIQNLINSTINEYLLNTIIFGCHKSGKKICIEGIETEVEMNRANDLDFDYLQGFYFYKPVSLKTMISLLKQQNSKK